MKKYTNQLKSDYEQRQSSISPQLWERIESRLEQEESPKKNKSLAWISVAATLALLIGFIVSELKKPENIHAISVFSGAPALKISQTKKDKILPIKDSKSVSRREAKEISTEKKEPYQENFDSVSQTPHNYIASVPESPVSDKVSPESKNQNEQYEVYTSAEELLFGAEIQREKNQSPARKDKMVQLEIQSKEIQKPKEIRVLGIKVYSETTE